MIKGRKFIVPFNGATNQFALNSTADINTMVGLANGIKNLTNPEIFYSKQLLDTIRYDASSYVYYRLADEMPIQEKADKLTVRRWAPLQAHTVPLEEGVPPKSDKGSVEKYEMSAHQYGRYMEFTDKVNFAVVDPVVAHYTREYALVAMETLDLLAREQLFSTAQKYYSKLASSFEDLKVDGSSKPTLEDLRYMVLIMKRALIKPRSNGRYHVIASPEFYYDMISDPTVEKYMTINQTTKTMYDNGMLVPLFEMEFYETFLVPAHGQFIKAQKRSIRVVTDAGVYKTLEIREAADATAAAALHSASVIGSYKVSGYVKDSRTGQDASYIPDNEIIDLPGWIAKAGAGGGTNHNEVKAHHCLMIGKDALVRTGLTGEGQTKVYVKPLGSAGVLDPIDQRQSIGFKINSVGFGCTRIEAVCEYICVPTHANLG